MYISNNITYLKKITLFIIITFIKKIRYKQYFFYKKKYEENRKITSQMYQNPFANQALHLKSPGRLLPPKKCLYTLQI